MYPIAHNIVLSKLLTALHEMRDRGYDLIDIRITDDFNLVLMPSKPTDPADPGIQIPEQEEKESPEKDPDTEMPEGPDLPWEDLS